MRFHLFVVLGAASLTVMAAVAGFSEDVSVPASLPVEKQFEVYVHGKKYPSIAAYKRAHLERQVREAVSQSKSEDLNVFQDGLRRALVAGDLHKLSLAVLQSVWMEFEKKIAKEFPAELNADKSVTPSDGFEYDAMKKVVELYQQQQPQEEPISVRPEAMKIITIKPATANR